MCNHFIFTQSNSAKGAKKSVCHCVMGENQILTCHMVTYTTHTRPSDFIILQRSSFPKQVFFVLCHNMAHQRQKPFSNNAQHKQASNESRFFSEPLPKYNRTEGGESRRGFWGKREEWSVSVSVEIKAVLRLDTWA